MALWKERTPTLSRPSARSSAVGSTTSVSPPPDFGRGTTNTRHNERNGRGVDLLAPGRRGDADVASMRSVRSNNLPPGFDVEELSPYTQSNEAVCVCNKFAIFRN